MNRIKTESREIQFVFPEEVLLSSEQIHQLAEASYSNGSPWTAENFSTDLEAPFVGYGFAIKHQKAIGFIGYHHFLGEAEITNFGVDHAYKNQGIGSQFLGACLNHLSENGMEQLFLEVRSGNKAAIAVYQKLDFEKVAVRKAYYRNPVEDAQVMRYSKLVNGD